MQTLTTQKKKPKIQIIDNFLPTEIFDQFTHHAITSPHFVGVGHTAYTNEVYNDNFAELQMQAILFRRYTNSSEISDCYLRLESQIKKIHELLKIKRLWLMRVNCTFGQKEGYQGAWHTDMNWTERLEKKGYTSIIYLNSNNGGTQFKNGPFIESKANRCVIAPMTAVHAGVWATNIKCRYVLNINYESYQKFQS